MTDWLLENQVKVLLILGFLSVLLTILVGDPRWPQVVAVLAISFTFISVAKWLYSSNTSENWLKLGYGSLLRNICCGVLTLIAWAFFLRGAFALSIGAALLRAD